MLLTEEPLQDQRFKQHAFFLSFHANDRVLQKFSPANIEVNPLELGGRQVYEVKLNFLTDLSSVHKLIAGAEVLHFWLEIGADALRSRDSSTAFDIYPETADKLANTPILVEFPEDFSAKKEESLKQKGQQVRDSLY